MAPVKAKKKSAAKKTRSAVGSTRVSKRNPNNRDVDIEVNVASIDIDVNVNGANAGLQLLRPAHHNPQCQDENSDARENGSAVDVAGDLNHVEELKKEIIAMKAALAKEQAKSVELRKLVEEKSVTENSDNNRQTKPIPRPSGTAGTSFSIQEAMGLAGSKQKYETYKAIQRNLRDLTMNARINWEAPWAKVPARDKAKLFEVARNQHPFLARFDGDWATEEIVKQFVKNKRKNHYKNGWLEVPEKYAYLKQNSMKRNPTASRTKRARASKAVSSINESGARNTA